MISSAWLAPCFCPDYLTSLCDSVFSMKTESETYDLAGSSAATIETTIREAFAEPFSHLSDDTSGGMIRLTFVTGAGKLGRARYDDGAAKAITSTLRELGYEEDRGASAVWECAGSFKQQHDTGKNLKTVVVFPKVVVNGDGAAATGASGGVGSRGGATSATSLLPEGTTEHKIAHTSMNVFPRMIESMCPTWLQKKGCVAAITELVGVAEKLDGKLMQGEPLTEPEQDFYDSVSMTTLQEKLACVRELMHKQVDDGKITSDERQQLLSQVSEKLDSLAKDISEAEQQGKAKRVENLKGAVTKAQARREKLQSTSTISPPPLKNENGIAKLRKELKPLLEVEEAAKGRLLTLKESQAIARKDEILEEIAELEVSDAVRVRTALLDRSSSSTPPKFFLALLAADCDSALFLTRCTFFPFHFSNRVGAGLKAMRPSRRA